MSPSWLCGCISPSQHAVHDDAVVLQVCAPPGTTSSSVNSALCEDVAHKKSASDRTPGRGAGGQVVQVSWAETTRLAAEAKRVTPFNAALNDAEAAAVALALMKVGALVQRFAEVRSEGTAVRSLRQALALIVEEWPGAFARIHIISKSADNALLLAGCGVAGVAVEDDPLLASLEEPRPSAHAPDAEPLLIFLGSPGMAISSMLSASTGTHSWSPDKGAGLPVPPDYAPLVARGAQVVSTVAVKLSGRTVAALTVGFVRDAETSHVEHELWLTYLQVIASGLASLVLDLSVPRYLAMALDLDAASDLDAVVVAVVRRLRELSGQARSTQLWYRVALTAPHSGHAMLLDVPSEVTTSLHISRPPATASPSQIRLSPLGLSTAHRFDSLPTFTTGAMMAEQAQAAALACASVSASSNANGSGAPAVRPPSPPIAGLSSSRSGPPHRSASASYPAPLAVVRTMVALQHAVLRHAVEGRQQVIVPNIQKLLNQSGGVAADVFGPRHIRPPAAMLLLPLVVAAPGGVAGGASLRFTAAFGAVYCMSSVLTDFADVKIRLREAVLEVLSPHLLTVLAQEPVAAEYHQALMTMRVCDVSPVSGTQTADSMSQAVASPVGYSESGARSSSGGGGGGSGMDEEGGLVGFLDGIVRTGSGDAFHFVPTSTTPRKDGSGSGAGPLSGSKEVLPLLALAAGSLGRIGVAGGSVGGSGGSSSSTIGGLSNSGAIPSFTSALVTGLADKISARRLSQTLDLMEPSDLTDLQLMDLLGVGGYGRVFSGKWRGMLAAIKLVSCPQLPLDDGGTNKAVLKHAHEIAILSSVSHPNITQAYTFMTDVGVSDVLMSCLRYVSPALSAEKTFAELLAMEGQSCHVEVLELCDMGSLRDALERKLFQGGTPTSIAVKPAPTATTGQRKGTAAAAPEPRDASSLAASAAAPLSRMWGNTASLFSSALFPLLERVPSASSRDSSGRVQASGGSARAVGTGRVSTPTTNLHSVLLSLVELASALSHLHSLGIVHCDIKPDNVLLKSSNNDARGFTLKLSDFGLSRVQDDDGCMAFPCNSCGTLVYVAPEALDCNKVDRSIDVYSFGILMYELYADTPPYSKMDTDDLMHAVITMGLRPKFKVGAHVGFVALACACWCQVPEERPTFNDVLRALNHMLTELESESARVRSYNRRHSTC